MDDQSLVIIVLLDGVADIVEIGMDFAPNQHTSLKGCFRCTAEFWHGLIADKRIPGLPTFRSGAN